MRTVNYTMATAPVKSSRKSVFEMSAEELRERVAPVAERIKKEAWAKNSYVTYFDEKLCPSTVFMVHEYSDRKELVRIKPNGETQFIKTL
jgi:hypothetical protein